MVDSIEAHYGDIHGDEAQTGGGEAKSSAGKALDGDRLFQ